MQAMMQKFLQEARAPDGGRLAEEVQSGPGEIQSGPDGIPSRPEEKVPEDEDAFWLQFLEEERAEMQPKLQLADQSQFAYSMLRQGKPKQACLL